MDNSPNGTGIDKEALYGNFLAADRENRKWQGRLYRKAAHKSLDIPDDADVSIHSQTRHGIGGLAAAGIALASSLPLAALAGSLLLKQPGERIEQPGPTETKTNIIRKTTTRDWRLGPETVIEPHE